MTQINWGILQPSDVGASFNAGFDRAQAQKAKRQAGAAVQAVLTDPANAGAAINALARFNPDAAMQLANFQQQQLAQQRDNKFRDASSRFIQSSGALNALLPQGTGQGVLGAALPMGAPSLPPSSSSAMPGMAGDVVPPISAAPPPPANWRETLGPDAAASLGARPLPSEPAALPSAIRPVDPNTAIDPYASQGIGAESGVTGQYAPGVAPGDNAPVGTPGAEMPEAIRRAANSPDMGARNAAFMEMMKLDPVQAMKIESELRDQTLDRLEDANKGYQLAVARLPHVRDDASYQRIVGEVDAILRPLGVNIRESIPANYPGPEGTRELLMKAMDAQQQLAAMDRRFSAEARVADIDADNERADRNTDSLIADRSERTSIARDRAALSAQREQRISSGGGRRGKGGKSSPTAVNPTTGERLVLKGGKWVPVK